MQRKLTLLSLNAAFFLFGQIDYLTILQHIDWRAAIDANLEGTTRSATQRFFRGNDIRVF